MHLPLLFDFFLVIVTKTFVCWSGYPTSRVFCAAWLTNCVLSFLLPFFWFFSFFILYHLSCGTGETRVATRQSLWSPTQEACGRQDCSENCGDRWEDCWVCCHSTGKARDRLLVDVQRKKTFASHAFFPQDLLMSTIRLCEIGSRRCWKCRSTRKTSAIAWNREWFFAT